MLRKRRASNPALQLDYPLAPPSPTNGMGPHRIEAEYHLMDFVTRLQYNSEQKLEVFSTSPLLTDVKETRKKPRVAAKENSRRTPKMDTITVYHFRSPGSSPVAAW